MHGDELVDITLGISMANTSGVDAKESLQAVQSKCELCCGKFVGIS